MKILLTMSVSVLAVLILLFLARSRDKGKDESSRLVVHGSQGRELKPSDLDGLTGTVKWAIVGSEHISRRAEELHELGRQAGQPEITTGRCTSLFRPTKKHLSGPVRFMTPRTPTY